MTVREFMRTHFKHFNAAVCVDAADAWVNHLNNGGKMFLVMAGAMSTAEIGISLAELIRKDLISGISCTGANLEEDIFNLVAHTKYERVPHYRNLSLDDEVALLERKMNRVTDTCIPEEEAMRRVEGELFKLWKKADQNGESYFPYEYVYQLLRSGVLEKFYEIDPKNSWLIAACEKNMPIWTPGWEDCTLGNVVAAKVIKGQLSSTKCIKSGIDQMIELVHWYRKTAEKTPLGFFQIGGGIAGDFPICVVPLIHQDMFEDCPLWAYFCQISDSTPSYGSYSGADPGEKITWGKLSKDTPMFVINSDATIVAPLIFTYVAETMAETGQKSRPVAKAAAK
jgi:deoxyhypusine synthase